MKAIHPMVQFVATALLVSLLFTMVCSASPKAFPSAGATEYVCPPCGCDSDSNIFDKPGACPSCGMALVDKSTVKGRQVVPRVARPRKNVAMLVFDGVETIDYTGPWEVFMHAGFSNFTVSEKPDPVTTTGGMRVIPNYTFDNMPKPDILLIPGGGIAVAQKNPVILKWVRDNSEKAEIVLSVCNGAFILAKAGLLNGLKATTTASLITGLALAAPNITVVRERFVDNGKIITSGGLSSGIDGALHVVSRVLGSGYAQIVALMMEYNWDPDSGFVRPALADRYVPDFTSDLESELLSTRGDRQRWEVRWSISSSASQKDLSAQIDRNLTGSKWTKQPSGSGGDAEVNRWKFNDENGKPWTASVSLQRLAGGTNKFVATVSVAMEGVSMAGSASRNQP